MESPITVASGALESLLAAPLTRCGAVFSLAHPRDVPDDGPALVLNAFLLTVSPGSGAHGALPSPRARGPGTTPWELSYLLSAHGFAQGKLAWQPLEVAVECIQGQPAVASPARPGRATVHLVALPLTELAALWQGVRAPLHPSVVCTVRCLASR